MKRPSVLGVCLLFALTVRTEAVRAESPRLSRDDQRTVDLITTAYFAGEPLGYAEPLTKLLGKTTDQRLAKIDEALKAQLVPVTAELITNVHLQAVEYGIEAKLPPAGPRETLSVLARLKLRVAAADGIAQDHRLMQDPLPDPGTLEEYDTLMWDAHVLETKIRNTAAIGNHMRRLVSGLSKRRVAELDAASSALIDDAQGAILLKLQLLLAEVEERQAEVRLQRLELALATLENPTLTTERFRAAYTAQVDADLLSNFLTNKSAFIRERLQSKDLLEQVSRDREKAQELAGDLTHKSQLLFTGLHWWLRGRYGKGTDVFGLAKSPAAMYSGRAQLALYMPQEFPKPNDPEQVSNQQQPVPQYDRRHHYWWAWEDRRVRRSLQFANEIEGDPGNPTYTRQPVIM
ncbi:MAG: hypothetical protein O3C40_34710 [Planctomycetota bacterium]|nr:hypothetical protein [Planctomycetota bacterium]